MSFRVYRVGKIITPYFCHSLNQQSDEREYLFVIFVMDTDSTTMIERALNEDDRQRNDSIEFDRLNETSSSSSDDNEEEEEEEEEDDLEQRLLMSGNGLEKKRKKKRVRDDDDSDGLSPNQRQSNNTYDGYNIEQDVTDVSRHDLKVVFALWNAMVGAGSVVVFPWAMSKSGVLLGAIIAPMFGFICCVFSAQRLVEHTDRRKCKDYSDVVGVWFGESAKLICRGGIVLLMVQTVIVYDMILSDVVFGLVSGGYADWRERHVGARAKERIRGSDYDDDSGTNTTLLSSTSFYGGDDDDDNTTATKNNTDSTANDNNNSTSNKMHTSCKQAITWESSLNGDCFTPKTASVIVGLLLFILATRTSADVFVKLSAFGPMFTAYLVAFVVLQSLVVEKAVAPSHFYPPRGGGAAFKGVSTLLGACSSAFFVHHAIVPVLKTNKKSKNNNRNLVFAYILAVATYTCVGIVGNFSSTYIDSESKRMKNGLQGPSENFLNAFPTQPNQALFAFTAHIAAAMQMFTICPLLLFILQTSVHGLVFGRRAETKTTLSGIAIVNFSCLLVGTLCAANKKIDVGGVVSVCGAVFGFIFVFLLPSLIRLQATRKLSTSTVVVPQTSSRYALRSQTRATPENSNARNNNDNEEEEEEEEEEERGNQRRNRNRNTTDNLKFWKGHDFKTLFFHFIFVAFGFSIALSNVF